jgi:hypothetical protein
VHVAKANWSPPDTGWVKVNLGVVARDDGGKVVLVAWQGIRRCASPEEADAEACLRGVRLAAEWIRQPIRMEGDCLTLIRAIGASQVSRSSIEGIINEIRVASRGCFLNANLIMLGGNPTPLRTSSLRGR